MSAKATLPAGLDLSRPHAPRWVASPRLRGLGFKTSIALKRPCGDYMSQGEAFDAALAINRMVDDFEAGLSIAGDHWRHLAPAHSGQPALASARSIGGLIDTFLVSEKFNGLEAATRKDYKSRLNRLVEALAMEYDGDPARSDLPPSAKAAAVARYTAKIRLVRDMDIMELLTDDNPLKDRYDALRRMVNPRTGHPMITNANSVLRYTQGWLTWVMDQKANGRRLIPFNPAVASLVPRTASPGRVNPWPKAELDRLDARGLELGWHSVIEARRMAAELSWSQNDILALRYRQFVTGSAYDDQGRPYTVTRVLGTRSKTGVFTSTTLTDTGDALFKAIKERWQTANGGPNIEPAPDTHLFVVDDIPGRIDKGTVGKPWPSAYFQHVFIDIKQACTPPITGYTFQDLRDTAFTEMKEAGMDDHAIQSRTQHASTESVQRLGAKHYGKVTLETSDAAARKLNALRERKGKR